jgi:hypothetical protein
VENIVGARRLLTINTGSSSLKVALHRLREDKTVTAELRAEDDVGHFFVDEETRDRLRHFLSALVEWTQRFEDPTKASQRQAREGRA